MNPEKLVELFNPYDVDLKIAGRDILTGLFGPATGLVLTARICAANDPKVDTPIHSSLQIGVTEGATVSADGIDWRRYYAAFPPDALLTHLDAYARKYVYQVVRTSTPGFRHVRAILVTLGAHALATPQEVL